ncbi:HupE/UreJ family protein [Gottfriedia sp. NPDC056225]|uniref:HupE/UreJ family protein n=1 Tax=Gottfriedia sp. NPDC056225 TaxID=3345751 RepID=UPI0015594B5A|nr:HupE/UreJ family protein [Arthrobacter citreus]
MKNSIFFLTTNKLRRSFPLFLCILIFFSTSFVTVEAHSLSASYTTLNLLKSKTTMNFALDEVSVMELTGGDVNKNGMLDQNEFEAIKKKIESTIQSNITLKINGEKQNWTKINKLELNRKGDATQLIVNVDYPAIQPSQSIMLSDSLYKDDSNTSTTYVDLLKVNYGKESSTAALSDEGRVWSMILSDSAYEGLSNDTNTIQPTKQQPVITKQSNPDSTTSPSSKGWISFLKLGMNHILTGYDHLLFLLSLLIARQSFKQFAKVITAFTVAHSLTLTLTVLGIISIPSYIVEPAIALSICYVAIENIFRKNINHRWVLTFIFGLIHGMGFADLLTAMHLSKSELAADLVSFNLGIEVIQLSIVLLLLPLLTQLHRSKYSGKAIISTSSFAFILGGIWLFERIIS